MFKTWNISRAAVAIAVVGLYAASATPAPASDTVTMVTVAEVLASPDAQGKLDGTVKFYFGDQRHPAVLQKLGEYITNKKTNGFNKSDQDSCNWTFLSAMIELQERAHKLGANAVIGIHSFYKRQDFSSQTQVQCYAGLLMSGVALKGNFVKIK